MFDGKMTGKPPVEIAGAVRMTAKHKAVEDGLAKARARFNEIGRTMRALSGARGRDIEADLTRLDQERNALVETMRPLLPAVVALRAERGEAVRAALAPAIASAAARALAAAVALKAALAEVDEVSDALARSHAEPIWLPLPDLAMLIERARLLAGKV
jgi:hypothetical protein